MFYDLRSSYTVAYRSFKQPPGASVHLAFSSLDNNVCLASSLVASSEIHVFFLGSEKVAVLILCCHVLLKKSCDMFTLSVCTRMLAALCLVYRWQTAVHEVEYDCHMAMFI